MGLVDFDSQMNQNRELKERAHEERDGHDPEQREAHKHRDKAKPLAQLPGALPERGALEVVCHERGKPKLVIITIYGHMCYN